MTTIEFLSSCLVATGSMVSATPCLFLIHFLELWTCFDTTVWLICQNIDLWFFFFFFTSYACYLCVESERNWGDTAGRCRCEMISHIKSSLLWENIQSALTVLQQNNQPVKSAVKASVHHSAESCRADANIQHLDDKLTTELCSPVLCATTFIILKVSECFHHISRHRLTSESLSNSTVAWTCAICLAQAGMQIGINQRH